MIRFNVIFDNGKSIAIYANNTQNAVENASKNWPNLKIQGVYAINDVDCNDRFYGTDEDDGNGKVKLW